MSTRHAESGNGRAPGLWCALRRFAGWLLLTLAVAVGPAGYAQTAKPDGLKAEYAVRPLGLDEPSPRLTWLSPVAKQTAYQIRVATTSAGLTSGQLVWDTGRVESGDSVLVPYAGSKLASRGRYWWQVRVWGQDGVASAWSSPEWWEM